MNTLVTFKSFLLALPSLPFLRDCLSSPKATTYLLPISKDQYAVSKTLYKWNYRACTLYCLASFTQHNILRFIHDIKFLMLIVHSFLFLRNIPLYEYTTICLLIHLLMNISVVSDLRLLQIKQLYPFLYKSSYWHMLSFPLNRYLWVEQQVCMTDVFLTF